jgi:4-hydroxy-tetrahydrodipicolinate reductase
MKIGLIGYGRMGKEIEHQARQLGHEVCAHLEVEEPLCLNSQLHGAEVLIDFTTAGAVMDTLSVAAQLGLPVVEGTTGWNSQLDRVKEIKNLTLIYSANFSIGVYQFMKLAEYAARLYGNLAEYDCYLHEWHHTGKADSPSGTALRLADILLPHLHGKEKILAQTSEGKIAPQVLHVTSTRVGRVPGTHEIGFDSASDFILLRHQAHGREGLARGAIRAAEWIKDKKGIFTMDDFMESTAQMKAS